MQKGQAGKWIVYAFQDEGGASPGTPVTGDAANITANLRIDGGAADAIDDTNPTELEEGYYIFDITATEADGDNILIAPSSVTANVSVIGVPGAVYTTPENFNTEALATSAQIDNIGAAQGGSLNFAPIEDNTGGAIVDGVTFVGSVASGTFASVGPGIATSHSIDDSGNDIDIVYGFQVGGSRVGTQISVNADVDGNADSMQVEVWDHVGSAWEELGVIANDTILSLSIVQKHTGTGSEIGKVYVRFDNNGTTPSNLEVFECLVSAVNVSQTVGYANGAIWTDTNNGTAGTENFVNGVADNPALTWADTLTLSGSLNIQRFELVSGSSITLTANSDNYFIDAIEATIALGGQSIAGAYINGATVSGIGTGSSPRFVDCRLGTITINESGFSGCALTDTITAGAAGTFLFDNCFSGVAGSGTPVFDFAAFGATALNMRHYSGGLEIENMATGDTMSFEGDGQLVINANCTAGTVNVRGNIRVTDNSGGGVSIQITPDVTGYVEGSVWVDEASGTSSGMVVGIDGTFQNQSDDFDNAQDVADALGTSRITIQPGNSITLSDSLQGYTVNNVQATLNGGSQDVDSTRFNGGFLAGTFTRSGSGIPTFNSTNLNNITSDRVACIGGCGILGTFTLTEAGVYVFNDAQAAGATSISVIDFASLGGATVSMQRWSGSLTINNMASGDTLNLHCSSGGNIILNGADATVVISGAVGTVTNNLTGSPTVSDNSIDLVNINSEVDTAITDSGLVSALAVVDTNVDAILVDTGTTLPGLLKEQGIAKNEDFPNFEFLMVLSSDGETPATGLTVTGQRSVDGGAFASVSGVISEVSNGIYQFDALAADTNGDVITWRFSSATALDRFITIKTVQ